MSGSPASLHQVIESPEATRTTFDLSERPDYLNRSERTGSETALTASPESGFEHLVPSTSAPDVTELLSQNSDHPRPHPPHRESTTSYPQVIPPTRESRTLVSCLRTRPLAPPLMLGTGLMLRRVSEATLCLPAFIYRSSIRTGDQFDQDVRPKID
jgi:hypothetical protein